MTTNCVICGTLTTKFCSVCNKVGYCTPTHQKEDWKSHKINCYPAKILESNNLGRYLIASRSIKKGEKIFRDKGLLAGPCSAGNGSIILPIICLGCFRVLGNHKKFSLCKKCKWPVCSAKCANVNKLNYANHRFSRCILLC